MKRFFMLLVSCLMFPASVHADPGVVIGAKGAVTITQSGKSAPAKVGTQFADGAVIDVAQGASATLMFSNGAAKKLSSGEKFVAEKQAVGQAGNPIIKGIAMAYNDATSASSGPTVHGMVKAVGGSGGAKQSGDEKLESERATQMQADLKQVSSLGLDKDGLTLMQAQVYYKYRQYQKMVTVLLPTYRSQGSAPTDMVKNLLALGYDKMGNPTEAAKYR